MWKMDWRDSNGRKTSDKILVQTKVTRFETRQGEWD